MTPSTAQPTSASEAPADPNGFTIRAKSCSGLAHLKRGIPAKYSLCRACRDIRASINDRVKKAFDKATESPSKFEHFMKDAFNRMRVPLALQVISKSVAEMLREAIATWAEFQKFGSLMELCFKLDRLVDIMNGAGQEKRAPIVNDSHREILYEALEC